MPDTYGEAYYSTALSKLSTVLTSLLTTMATGYDPTLSYLYEHHAPAMLRLNAVSIGLEEMRAEPALRGAPLDSGNAIADKIEMIFSIRVHNAYDDGDRDDDEVAKLMNSIRNKLMTNMNLADYYRMERIEEFVVGQTFAESRTLGGYMNAVVSVKIKQTQE